MSTKNKFFTATRVFAALAVWWVIYKGGSLAFSSVFIDKVPEIVSMVVTSMVIPYALALPAAYLVIRNMKKTDGTSLPLKISAGNIGKIFVIQSGLSFLLMAPVNIVIRILGVQTPATTPEQIMADPVFYGILLLLFAPVMEEIVFRKIFLTRLLTIGTVPAIFISAAFFALPHLYSQGPAQVLYTFVLGTIWAYVMIRTKKLWPSVLLHSLSNLYGGIITAFWPKESVVTLLPFAALYMMVMPCAAILLTVLNGKKIRASLAGH